MESKSQTAIVTGASLVQIVVVGITFIGTFAVLLFKVDAIGKTTENTHVEVIKTNELVQKNSTRLTIVETKLALRGK